jgi:tyrosyl-tRNA synthetase
MGIFDAFRKSGLCKSNGEARRLMNQGGLYLNNEVVSDPDYRITAQDLLEGTALLRAGKKRYHRLTLQ